MKDPDSFREAFAALCTACGRRAFMCPPFAHRSVPDTDQEVQKEVRSYLGVGPPAPAVMGRSRLCNECYECVADTCHLSLNPMPSMEGEPEDGSPYRRRSQ